MLVFSLTGKELLLSTMEGMLEIMVPCSSSVLASAGEDGAHPHLRRLNYVGFLFSGAKVGEETCCRYPVACIAINMNKNNIDA